ncbi:MAG: DUF4190 domain-containing protein [Mycobacterium sp.]|uniref:DUF4190 domain-containing protein n=1 Tax=Mycobacterium sp. TaxID=1785 RepID=UPI003C713396
MTAQGGGGRGEEYRAHPNQPRPWEQYPHPPVDPQAPVNYPEFAPPYPPQPPYPAQTPPGPGYGYPPPAPGGPIGYGGPPPYFAPYDPYQVYQAGHQQTNGLAVASLSCSLVGIPLSFLCYLGLPLAIAGIVLGVVSLSQVNRSPQQGRGLAIAGIAIGTVTVTLLLASIAVLAAHHPTFIGG